MTAMKRNVIGSLQKVRLAVKTRRRGMYKGARASNQLGASLEFSDFRMYQPGDDVRQIDWNVYGRTQKHYIKRFLDEQELNVALILDATQSMQVIDSKWQRAKELAAAFSYITLSGEDRLSFLPIAARDTIGFTRKGAIYSKSVYKEIMQISHQESTGSFIELLKPHNLRNIQVTIIITDGLEEAVKYEALLKSLVMLKHEVKFIQLLSKQEIEPDLNGDLKLIDSETAQSLNVSLHASVLERYKQRLRAHNKSLEETCKRFAIPYLFVTDSMDLQEFLFHDCRVRGVLR
ncbi:DUF58 domain-containing protein [Neobacillus sp. LXY-1]|uniref:DUF58 domain-containing protein n=1 Tax=Neobacillus sp. LXY-1 TaxID=3379133 RepID=UPI003EE38761